MSKTGQDFFTMQEDAIQLTKEEFVKKYGVINADLYDQILEQNDPDPEFLVE